MAEPTETSELQAFAKTVAAQSVSRAAAELGVPRATISRRLARLEERLGVRLIRRTTRSLRLTDAGETLYRHAQIVLDAVAQAEESVRRTDDLVRGDLRVSIPPIVSTGFRAMLSNFARRHPSVRLHVHLASRHVDLLREGFDVALRASTELAPGLRARTLAESHMIAVASPAYLASFGVPRTARDLRKHRLLLGFARGDVPQSHWPRVGGGKVHVEGHFFANDVGLLADAAREGLGIALLPEAIVAPLIDSRELVRVLAKVIEGKSTVALVYPEREFLPPQVRAFVDAVAAWAPKELAASALEAVGKRATAEPPVTPTRRKGRQRPS